MTTLVAVSLLSGCSINAGSSAASAFEDEFANAEGVASVTTQGSNTLPFAGSVSVLVVAESGLVDERVDELARQITEYTSSHGSASWDAVVLDADAIRVGLSSDDDENSTRLSVARDLTATEHAVAASVAVDTQRVPGVGGDPIDTTPALIAVAMDESTSLIDGYEVAAAAMQSVNTEQHDQNAVAMTADGAFVLDDESGQADAAPFADALDSFAAVSARYDLSGAHVTPQSIMVRAVQEELVPEVQGFLAGIPSAAALEVDVQGGNVTTSASTSPAAQSVASEIGAWGTVTAGDDTVRITVSDFRDAREAFAAAQRSPDFTALRFFSIHSADAKVQNSPGSFENTLLIAEAALETRTTSRIEASAEGYKFWLKDITDGELAAFIDAVKPGLVAGDWTTFVNAGSFVGWFTATDVVTFEDSYPAQDSSAQDAEDRFAELWDASGY
ncbi:MAG TPA: hypothetical protein DIW46_04655 [Microbacterium sp.]|nr:hypothetical protein [Microbacterium sp.]